MSNLNPQAVSKSKTYDAVIDIQYNRWLNSLKEILGRYPLIKPKKSVASNSKLKSYYKKFKYTPEQAAQIIILGSE
jgi:hypothetical protein